MISIDIVGAESIVDMLNEAAKDTKTGIHKGLVKAGEALKAEAKARCPVDTGALRGSIKKNTSAMECEVGTNTEYAGYVEFGTCKMAAQPYLVPALIDKEDEVVEIIKDAIQ